MITSRHNPKIQRVRELLGRPRDRREAGAFVVEGVRLAEEALAAGWEPQIVLFSSELSPRGREVVDRLGAGGVEVEEVAPDVLQSVSETETSQGLLAVLPIRPLPIPSPLDFLVIADAIHDPGNLGTLLRTAAAAGVQAVALAPGTADPYSPKVVRAAMGAHFRLPISALDWEGIQRLVESTPDMKVYLAEAGTGEVCWQADLRGPLALVIGSEAQGATPAARRLAGASLQIPMPGQSESLNAAIAAAVLMFEVVRQRAKARGESRES